MEEKQAKAKIFYSLLTINALSLISGAITTVLYGIPEGTVTSAAVFLASTALTYFYVENSCYKSPPL